MPDETLTTSQPTSPKPKKPEPAPADDLTPEELELVAIYEDHRARRKAVNATEKDEGGAPHATLGTALLAAYAERRVRGQDPERLRACAIKILQPHAKEREYDQHDPATGLIVRDPVAKRPVPLRAGEALVATVADGRRFYLHVGSFRYSGQDGRDVVVKAPPAGKVGMRPVVTSEIPADVG